MPRRCWLTTPSPLLRASKMTKWWLRFPSRLRNSCVCRCSPTRGNTVNLFQFMAAEQPSGSQIKKCRASKQGQEGQELHNEARMHGELCIVHSEPRRHAHDC